MRQLLFALCCVTLLFSPAWADTAPVPNQRRDDQNHRMEWLDNGVIRLGVDLDLGGAITFLSCSQSRENIINNWDWGRQVQMSFYSGPVPYEPHGKKPQSVWAGIGWNPIQSGDCYGHGAKVLEHRNDGKSIYVKTVPMQWPLDNEPGECTCAWTITLEGAVARVEARFENQRADPTQYPARNQELPAIYVNGAWFRLITYTGDKPWSGKPVTELDTEAHPLNFPWIHWNATEQWAAFINKEGWGLGVWHPRCQSFCGGFVGPKGHGGSHDGQTGYISPNFREILDYNIQYDYRFCLILGTAEEIRAEACKRAAAAHSTASLPAYLFKNDRQHWTYRNATDTGWPIRGELNVALTQGDPQLIGPRESWPATSGTALRIEAAIHGGEKTARIFWTCADEPNFSESKSLAFPVVPDGEYHTYEVPLNASPEYRSTITGFRFDPLETGGPGYFLKLRSITVH